MRFTKLYHCKCLDVSSLHFQIASLPQFDIKVSWRNKIKYMFFQILLRIDFDEECIKGEDTGS